MLMNRYLVTLDNPFLLRYELIYVFETSPEKAQDVIKRMYPLCKILKIRLMPENVEEENVVYVDFKHKRRITK